MPNVPSDEEFLAYNQGIISEFHAQHGVVSQLPFPVLLLTTTGARTGRTTTVPQNTDRVFPVIVLDGVPAPRLTVRPAARAVRHGSGSELSL